MYTLSSTETFSGITYTAGFSIITGTAVISGVGSGTGVSIRSGIIIFWNLFISKTSRCLFCIWAEAACGNNIVETTAINKTAKTKRLVIEFILAWVQSWNPNH